MHVAEKLEWHRQIGEEVARDLIKATVDVGKLQKMVIKLANQLKK